VYIACGYIDLRCGILYNQLHKELIGRDIHHADETSLQVLHEPGKSYMWLYRTSGYAEHPVVLYEYQPNKSLCNSKSFLNGFMGYLHTDGY